MKPLLLLVIILAKSLRFVTSLSNSPGIVDSFLEGGGDLHLARNKSLKFGNLIIPANYDRFTIPLLNPSGIQPVYVSLTIRSILEVDQKNGELKVDADFGVSWYDELILKKESDLGGGGTRDLDTVIKLDASILRVIWKPDISIEQLSSISRQAIMSQQIEVRKIKNGEFFYNTRLEMSLRCDMNFKFFPADTQNCPFQIRSYKYNADEIDIHWEPGYHPYLESTQHPNFDLMLHNVSFNWQSRAFLEEKGAARRGNYTILRFSIKARRHLSYHLVLTYLPSFLLIMITWLCFLLPSDMVEARIGISMTTVLTLTALFASVRQQSPDVSYTMAIDVWMVFNIFMVFVTLIIFTTTYWAKRSFQTATTSVDDNRDAEKVDDALIRSRNRYRRIVKFTKDYAFWSFAVTFALFVTVYWICLIIDSRYLSFRPCSEFNGGIGNASFCTTDNETTDGRYSLHLESLASQNTNDGVEQVTVETDTTYTTIGNMIISP